MLESNKNLYVYSDDVNNIFTYAKVKLEDSMDDKLIITIENTTHEVIKVVLQSMIHASNHIIKNVKYHLLEVGIDDNSKVMDKIEPTVNMEDDLYYLYMKDFLDNDMQQRIDMVMNPDTIDRIERELDAEMKRNEIIDVAKMRN